MSIETFVVIPTETEAKAINKRMLFDCKKIMRTEIQEEILEKARENNKEIKKREIKLRFEPRNGFVYLVSYYSKENTKIGSEVFTSIQLNSRYDLK